MRWFFPGADLGLVPGLKPVFGNSCRKSIVLRPYDHALQVIVEHVLNRGRVPGRECGAEAADPGGVCLNRLFKSVLDQFEEQFPYLTIDTNGKSFSHHNTFTTPSSLSSPY